VIVLEGFGDPSQFGIILENHYHFGKLSFVNVVILYPFTVCMDLLRFGRQTEKMTS